MHVRVERVPDKLKGSWDYIYTQFKQAVRHHSAAEREALFAGNASRFYRIQLS